MKKDTDDAVHAWLVLSKAMLSIGRFAMGAIVESGLGESDFRILEVLLHKGPLPVNTIGPIVHLTPGSISVAVDRLLNKGLVTRAESADDRRVKVVSLTKKGRDVIVPVFKEHAEMLKRVFDELTARELRELQTNLKKAGKRADTLLEEQGPREPGTTIRLRF